MYIILKMRRVFAVDDSAACSFAMLFRLNNLWNKPQINKPYPTIAKKRRSNG